MCILSYKIFSSFHQLGIRHGEDALGLVEGIKPANGQGKSGGGGWSEKQPGHSETQGSPLRLTAFGGSGCNENSSKWSIVKHE